MCGILYSQNKEKLKNLSLLKLRGPEGFKDYENELGYFAHSMLNTIGPNTPQPYQTSKGILLYNGSIYNDVLQNDTKWIGQQLDDKVSDCIDLIKSLNGEYALIYVNEKHIIFCVDHFDQRNLWFYFDQQEKILTISSIPSIVKKKHGVAWRVEGNKIYVVDKNDYTMNIFTNKEWNLDQNINHFDFVFEKFEKAVKERYIPGTSALLLSSGYDSGVINCAAHKIHGTIDSVCDPTYEVIETIKERMFVHKCVILKNDVQHLEKQKMFRDIITSNELWEDASVEPLINIIKKYVQKKNKKILLFGTGGDEIYNDHHEQVMGFRLGRTNGIFPGNLKIVWPWYNHSGRLEMNNTRNDFICGFFGIEARNPLLDVQLVQSWLNTTHKLKNKSYKSWMQIYMDQENYPYTKKKVHWGEPDYLPEPWKITR